MTTHYEHLGMYSGRVVAASALRSELPVARPGKETRARILAAMNSTSADKTPRQA